VLNPSALNNNAGEHVDRDIPTEFLVCPFQQKTLSEIKQRTKTAKSLVQPVLEIVKHNNMF